MSCGSLHGGSRNVSVTSNLLLSVKNLSVTFSSRNGVIRAVRGISFDLCQGEVLGIVGETGSGKSVSCKALTRLLPAAAHIEGNIFYKNVDLVSLSKKELNSYRGSAISMIFQDPLSCLNPIKTIGLHMKEVLGNGVKKNPQKAVEALESLHIRNAGRRLSAYPFEFSGGMAQRVQIAMALAKDPEILIADEPTTALDVTIQAKILKELRRLVRELNLAMIFVTHDLGVVAEVCDRIAVMYHGRIVETGSVENVIAFPKHPYTKALLSSVPLIAHKNRKLLPITGEGLPASVELPGCDFSPRCQKRKEKCFFEKPALTAEGDRIYECFFPYEEHADSQWEEATPLMDRAETEIVMSVSSLSCAFPVRGENGQKETMYAVRNASFNVYKGEILGIVGESGSGKSTLAKALLGILTPESGEICYMGTSVVKPGCGRKDYSRKVQYVFQDPLGALDPRMSILRQCVEPLEIHGIGTPSERLARAKELLVRCGLDPSLFRRKPLGLSGGQRQRAVIARALIISPKILICDEPVSAMDVSVQAQILNLIRGLAISESMTIILISHDLSVIRNICSRVLVMREGFIVEDAPVERLFSFPGHEYSKQLIQSIPKVSFAQCQYDTVKEQNGYGQ